MWTKDFKSSPSEEDDVEEDDVENTGEGSGKVSYVDEDQFEKEMCLDMLPCRSDLGYSLSSVVSRVVCEYFSRP